MSFGSWITRAIDTITPWDRGGEVERRKKREEESQQNISQPRQQTTPTVRQPNNPITDIINQRKPTNIGLEPNNQVDVPQKSEYDNQLPPPPKQSFWNKVRDQFDANTEADKYRRLERDSANIRNDLLSRGVEPNKATETSVKIAKSTAQPYHGGIDTLRDYNVGLMAGGAKMAVDTVKGIGRGAKFAATNPIESGREELAKLTNNKEAERAAKYRQLKNAFGGETLKDGELGYGDLFEAGSNVLSVLPVLKGVGMAETATRQALTQGGKQGAVTATKGVLSGVDEALFNLRDFRNIFRKPNIAKEIQGAEKNLAEGGALSTLPREIDDLLSEAAIRDLTKTDIPVTQEGHAIGEAINVRNTNQPKPLIQETSRDEVSATPNRLIQQNADGARAEQRFNFNKENQPTKPEIDAFEGVTPRQPDKPFSLNEEVVSNSQDKLIDDYASFLKSFDDDAKGGTLIPDGERYGGGYKRTSEHSGFYRDYFKDNKRKPPLYEWKNEARRQLESGKAELSFQKSYNDVADPEVQSLLAKGERPDTPQGRPIQVKEVNDIPVVDKTEVPQGLPEQPGKVRAMAQTDKQAVKTQIAAEQPPVVPPNSIPKETGTPIAQEGRTTVERFANQIDDASTREVVNDALDELNKTLKKNKVNVEETTERAVKTVNNETLEESLRNAGKTISGDGSGLDPQQITDELMRAKKLLAMEQTPEVQKAVSESINALQDAGSKHGTGLVMFRHLFDSLPPEMKSQYLVERVGKQLRKLGVEMQPSVRAELLSKIDNVTNLEKSLDEVETALRANSEKIKLTGQGDLTRAEVNKLNKLHNDLTIEKELANERALEYSAKAVREHSAGKVDKVIQASKTSMLSNPLGAIRDVVVTPLTSIADLTTNAVQGTAGRVLNKLPGQAGKFREFHLRDLGELAKGNVQGVKDTARALTKDERRLDDFVKEYQRATRTDSKAGLRTRVGRFIGDTREAATNITRGQKDMMNTQLVRQQGQKLGLKGKSLDDFVNTTKVISDAKTQDQAAQFWLRSNNLHRNNLAQTLGSMTKFLESKGNTGKLASHIMAPFKSWQAGNFDRLFTDKNMIHNIYKIGDGIAKQDSQMVVDNLSRLATNTGEAFVGGMLLQKAGILSDKNTNGEDYNGPYINIGGRSISLSTFGPGAMNMTVGYNLQKLFNGEHASLGEFSNSLMKQLKGIAGTNQTLGGENPIQTALGTGQYGQDENSLIAKSVGSIGRMFMPASGAMNATNSFLNMNETLNPTGERAKTKATKEVVGADGKTSEKTDAWGTEVNKIKNMIPLVSQSLPREEGKTFRDPLDIVTAGSHANDSSTKARNEEQAVQSAKDAKNARDKQYREGKTPESSDGIRKSFENGDIDGAIRGEEWAMERANDDGELSKKTRGEYEERINRLKTAKDKNLSVEDVDEYEHTTLSEWRAMADDNPELYQKLWAIDEAMAKAGASFAKGDNKKQKYSAKKSGSGRGRGGSKINKLSADFGRLTGVGSNAPKVREYQTMAESTKILPRIKRIQPNIVHTIRSGRV